MKCVIRGLNAKTARNRKNRFGPNGFFGFRHIGYFGFSVTAKRVFSVFRFPRNGFPVFSISAKRGFSVFTVSPSVAKRDFRSFRFFGYFGFRGRGQTGFLGFFVFFGFRAKRISKRGFSFFRFPQNGFFRLNGFSGKLELKPPETGFITVMRRLVLYINAKWLKQIMDYKRGM